MKPYCPNNSNFTFREICCGPPIHHNCNCANNCGCNNCNQNHGGCRCEIPSGPKPCCPPKENLKEKDSYICLPIKKGNNCNCSPFLYIMIGYMIGSSYPFDEDFKHNENFDF